MRTGRLVAWWLALAVLAAGAVLTWRVRRGERADPPQPHDLVFRGTCDASAGVALTAGLVLIASDDDNILRAYDSRAGGEPAWTRDFSLELQLREADGTRQPEADIEAATRLGDLAYFLTSHARDRRGRLKPERFRLFATTTGEKETDVRMVGAPYTSLLDDLLREPSLEAFRLGDAANEAAGSQMALNIEGMTARVEGGAWLGFRSPLPGGNALAVPLLNPERMIHGARAEFGAPVLLPLGGLGIRGLSAWGDRYLVIGGPATDAGAPRLFLWDGKASARAIDGVDVSDLNSEGLLTSPTTGEALLLSDDGRADVEGNPCKQLKAQGKQRFRGRWFQLRL